MYIFERRLVFPNGKCYYVFLTNCLRCTVVYCVVIVKTKFVVKIVSPIVLLLLLASNTLCQTLDYFGNNPKWRCSQLISNGLNGPDCWENNHQLYYFDGDTLLNGETYHKLYEKGWTQLVQACWEPKVYYDNVLRAFLRQDGKKVYTFMNGMDTLFMDYQLNVGDTIPPSIQRPNPIIDTADIVVTSIDSILLNGVYHKKFFFTSSFGNDYEILEGVGTWSLQGTSDFLEITPVYLETIEYFKNLHCYYQNDILLHGEMSCDLTDMDFNISVTENDPIASIRISPNPTSDFVEVLSIKKLDLSVWNVYGQNLDVDVIEISEGYRIPLANQSSGIYYLIAQKGDLLMTKKIIVSH